MPTARGEMPLLRLFAALVAVSLVAASPIILKSEPSEESVHTRATYNPPPGWPTQREITGIIRDFHGQQEGDCSATDRICKLIPNGCIHPDFQRAIGSERNLVLPDLGADRLPRFNPNKIPSWTITSIELANMWYRTQTTPIKSGGSTCYINKQQDITLVLNWDYSQGLYKYVNHDFFPINGKLNGNFPTKSDPTNFHFTVELHSRFRYTGIETFSFIGDDDVWVFVNNKLAIDLGGVHGAESMCFSLIQPGKPGYPNGQCEGKWCPPSGCNLVTLLGVKVGETYNFDFFFAERHTTQSNIEFTTNFPLATCLTPDVCGQCDGTVTVDVCLGANAPNCGTHGECSCALGGCYCNAGWKGEFCDSYCGDGIVQSAEECDTGTTNTGCCKDCKFVAAGTTCPLDANPCMLPVCNGAGTCGVAKNTDANGNPIVCKDSVVMENGVAQPCKRWLCSAGACVTGPKQIGTDCGSTSCTQRQCNAQGQCAVTNTVTCTAAGSCFAVGTCQANSNNNQFPGTCSNPPLSFGQSCGFSSNPCVERICDGQGNCINRNVADDTTCDSGTECFEKVCRSGVCVTKNVNAGQKCGATPAQCTSNICRDGACVNVAVTGSCSATGADSQCQYYSCSDGKCATLNKPQGTICSLSQPNSCSAGQCSLGACVAVPANQGAVCTSGSNGAVVDPGDCQNMICQGTQCVPTNVNSGLSCTGGPSVSEPDCNRNVCVSGVCSTVPTNPGGTCSGAGMTEPACQKYSCSNGNCVVVSQNEGLSCDLPTGSTNDCSIGVCARGACQAVAAPVKQGQTCSTGSNGQTPAATACQAPQCHGTECLLTNINEGQTFTTTPDTGCPQLSELACQQYRCVQGACTLEAKNVGGQCDPPDECNNYICKSDGSCAAVYMNENVQCGADKGTCDPSVCRSGVCTLAPLECKPPTDCYLNRTCTNGVCSAPVLDPACTCGDGTLQPSPGGTEECDTGYDGNPCCTQSCLFAPDTTPCGVDTECKTFRCNGISTTCLQSNANEGAPCSELEPDECNDVACDGNGNCVYVALSGSGCGSPTDCQIAKCGSGSATERALCEYSGVQDGTSCTSLAGSKECHDKTCQAGVCSFNYIGDGGSPCTTVSSTECSEAKCSSGSKACALFPRRSSASSAEINCTTAQPASACAVPQCDLSGACSMVPLTGTPCTVSGYVPDGCASQQCNDQGECALVAETDGVDCSAQSGLSAECQKAICVSGTCALGYDAAASCSSLQQTQCADPVCDSTTLACRYQSKRTADTDPAIDCDGPTTTQCTTAQCAVDGVCALTPLIGQACSIPDFTSDGCSSPVCDSDGLCSLKPAADGTACTLSTINPDCQRSECVAGVCSAVSKRQSAADPAIACSSVSDTPCEVAQCGLDGVCRLVSLADGHQPGCDALHISTDVCSEMLCRLGTCERVPLVAGTACTDENLCDNDACDGQGECVRTPTDVANSCAIPLSPCYSMGWCEPKTGACNYTKFKQGALCSPQQEDPKGCRYFTCSADAVCTRACVVRTVCGNGVVETGEDCDWAARSYTSKCCTQNCTWYDDYAPCNTTRNMTALLEDIPSRKHRYAEDCIQDYCDAEHSCVSSWNQTSSKVCVLGGSSNTDYVAGVAAGLTVAACAALAAAAAALGLFIWQFKKADNAWTKEFMDEHRGAIEQNAAFKGPASNPSNPAYGLN